MYILKYVDNYFFFGLREIRRLGRLYVSNASKLGLCIVSYSGRDKMAAISQTFSNSYFQVKCAALWFKYRFYLFLVAQSTISKVWLRQYMVCRRLLNRDVHLRMYSATDPSVLNVNMGYMFLTCLVFKRLDQFHVPPPVYRFLCEERPTDWK